MKKIMYLLLLLCGVVIFGCKEEEPEPEKTVDPCENVTCLNGGECNGGECDCPEGYRGEMCEEMILDREKFLGQWAGSDPMKLYVDNEFISETENTSGFKISEGIEENQIYIDENTDGQFCCSVDGKTIDNEENQYIYIYLETDSSIHQFDVDYSAFLTNDETLQGTLNATTEINGHDIKLVLSFEYEKIE